MCALLWPLTHPGESPGQDPQHFQSPQGLPSDTSHSATSSDLRTAFGSPVPHLTWAWESHRRGGRPSLPRLKNTFPGRPAHWPPKLEQAGVLRVTWRVHPPREPKEECHLSLCSESSDPSLCERGSLLPGDLASSLNAQCNQETYWEGQVCSFWEGASQGTVVSRRNLTPSKPFLITFS